MKSMRDYLELTEEEERFLDNYQKLPKEKQELLYAAMTGDAEAFETLRAFVEAHQHELEK